MTAIPATAKYLRERLAERFGFKRFRPGQLETVRSAIEGRDVLAIMPTGSGKSLCFQLPALELDGTTVVISPLIALMKDQADALRQKGIEVAVVNSTLSAAERKQAEEDIASGKVEFVYTTPEQIASPAFRAVLKAQPTDLFVVDEAHCVSQWGHDFRPEYLTLWEAIDDLGRPPVLALTATATADVVDDILARLRIPDAAVVHTGFHRENLYLTVRRADGDRDKQAALLDYLEEQSGTGIVYAATVKAVEELAADLTDRGVSVAAYHGRLSPKRRAAAQDRFMAGEVRALVATNAFGLGIDKPDIRFVAHYHAPATMEAFYQEFGRAGRDGAPADGLLLYDPADQRLHRFFAGGRYPDEADLVNAYHALTRMAGPFDLPSVAAISPVPKARLKVCLDLFVNRGVVRHEPGGDYVLAQSYLTRDDVARAGQSYKERRERDLLKAQAVTDYAERRACRWRAVLGYFESDEIAERCGHCDRCH